MAGPFRAAAFASFLSIITTARFATATRYLELIMAEDLDAQVYDDMLHIRTDPVQERDPGGLAPGQIALVEASLTQVKFREMLGRAVSSLPKARD